MGPRKEAKDLRKGGSWELLFSTTPIYIYYKASSEGDDYVQYVEVPSHADRVQLHVKFDGPSG